MKSNRERTLAIVLVLIVLLVTGCDPGKKWQKQEEMQISDYLSSIGDTVYTKEPSGLYFLDLTVGTGATPVVHDTVAIKYKGMFISGVVFGTNYNDTTVLRWIVGNNAVIQGLDEGVRYMKKGGKAKMLLPSSLAYGSFGYYTIPGYTPLLFEVILTELKPGSGKK